MNKTKLIVTRVFDSKRMIWNETTIKWILSHQGLHRQPCGAETVKVGACAGSQREAQADVQGKKGAKHLFWHSIPKYFRFSLPHSLTPFHQLILHN